MSKMDQEKRTVEAILRAANGKAEDDLYRSDEVLAQDFVDEHLGSIRYTALRGRWFIWDGTRWAPDEKLQAFSLVRVFCHSRARLVGGKHAPSIASSGTVASVEHLARADQRIAITVGQWDAHPWLLNLPNGTVDLRTGKVSDHDPADNLTKVTGIGADWNCPAPLWADFLNKITGNNEELISYLKRMAGYSLTGSTREHALFFLYGTGANGKSTFVNAITTCAGEYHRVAPIETFIASRSDRHPTELAGLHGARLVTAIETQEGRRWDESKIKSLTGGDTISARFMRQDFFDFVPQFKLIIAGNHKPGLRSVDEAIRRRFNLVPFTITIPPEERDLKFAERLTPEMPGIMAWMIDGCTEWQRRGLDPPKIVTEATEAYLATEDALSAWLDECTEQKSTAFAKSSHLFASWKGWATANGEEAGSSKALSSALEKKGFQQHRTDKARGFYGLRVLLTYEQHESSE